MTSPLIKEMKEIQRLKKRMLRAFYVWRVHQPEKSRKGFLREFRNMKTGTAWFVKIISLYSLKNRCGICRGCTRPLEMPQHLLFFAGFACFCSNSFPDFFNFQNQWLGFQ